MQKIDKNINDVQITQSSSTSSSSHGCVEQVLVWTLLHSFSAWQVQNIEHDYLGLDTTASAGGTWLCRSTATFYRMQYISRDRRYFLWEHDWKKLSIHICPSILFRISLLGFAWKGRHPDHCLMMSTCSPNVGDVGGKDFNFCVLLILCLAIFDDQTPKRISDISPLHFPPYHFAMNEVASNMTPSMAASSIPKSSSNLPLERVRRAVALPIS